MRITLFDCNSYSHGKKKLLTDIIGAGPRTVAGILEQYGFEVKIYFPDFYNERYVKKSDIILFSGMISDFKIIKKLSKKFKNKKQICGGMISFEYEKLLGKTNIDIVILGEAEITFRELIENNFNPKGIVGTAYKEYDKIIFNGYRKFISQKDMKLITPSVERVKDYFKFYAKRVYVEVLRGCSNFIEFMGFRGCGFCAVPNVFGYPKYREIENIVKEIKGLLKIGVKRIVLSAPDILDYKRKDLCVDPANPKPNINALKELFTTIKNLCKKYNAYFRIENVKPCLVNDDVAKMLSELPEPCIVGIGVESGNDRDLKLMNKPYDTKIILNALKLLDYNNVHTNTYIIYGLPFQNKNSIIATINFVKKMFNELKNLEKITISQFIPIPMSAFYIFRNTNYKELKEITVLKNLVNELNLKIKTRKYSNKIITVFPIGKYDKDKWICYPTKDGPYVLCKIKNPSKIIKVKIINATSRVLEGIQI